MKNSILRILTSASIFALLCSIVVAIFGLRRGWTTAAQYSDGFFWASVIIFSLGFLNLIGMLSQRTVSGLHQSQSAVHLDMEERYRIWEADIFRGYQLLGLLGVAALELFGISSLALLIGKLLA
jgi:hypothetical protein